VSATKGQIVENAPRTEIEKDLEVESETAEKPRPPVGCVERVLNFRDRNLIIGACREFCLKDGKGGHKAQSKLNRLTKLLDLQETVDYFEMVNDSMEDEVFKWQRLRNNWLSWQQHLAGGLTLEELQKRAPSVDLSDPPNKPPRKQPEATPEDLRGKDRAFHIPSKLDAWIQECLEVANWDPMTSEYVTELCQKFGLKSED
jgi:hypothetical protein